MMTVVNPRSHVRKIVSQVSAGSPAKARHRKKLVQKGGVYYD